MTKYTEYWALKKLGSVIEHNKTDGLRDYLAPEAEYHTSSGLVFIGVDAIVERIAFVMENASTRYKTVMTTVEAAPQELMEQAGRMCLLLFAEGTEAVQTVILIDMNQEGRICRIAAASAEGYRFAPYKQPVWNRREYTDEKKKNEEEQHYWRIKSRRICSERQVPYNVGVDWLMSFNGPPTEEAMEAHAKEFYEKIKSDWPAASKEEYLQKIEASSDWDGGVFSDRYNYWPDIGSILPDAVRLGACRLVGKLAPHFLFRDEEKHREVLKLAATDEMRAALGMPVFRDEAEYAKYPFSYRINSVAKRYKAEYITRDAALLNMDEGVQPCLWEDWLKDFVHDTEQQLHQYLMYGKAHRGKIKADIKYLEYMLYCLGYEHDKAGFHRRPLPELWLTKEEMEPMTPKERLSIGMDGMYSVMLHSHWNMTFEGTNNGFGCTGYVFLKEKPR